MKLNRKILGLSGAVIAVLVASSVFAFVPGKEITITYYKTSKMKTEVGGYYFGCGMGSPDQWGQKTKYFKRTEHKCTPGQS